MRSTKPALIPPVLDQSSEMAAARKAGWRRVDLIWERLQEQANSRYHAGDNAAARDLWRRAGWLALWRFRRSDPRRATTQANLALAERLAGREDQALRRYAKARLIWRNVDKFIATMRIARASPLQVRMEPKHWATCVQNMRVRMTIFSRETSDAFEALEHGKPPHRRLDQRWQTEKPAIFDDTRILIAAALLVAAPIDPAPARQSLEPNWVTDRRPRPRATAG